TDSSGALLLGVTITATSSATAAAFTVPTTSEGLYRLPFLPSGFNPRGYAHDINVHTRPILIDWGRLRTAKKKANPTRRLRHSVDAGKRPACHAGAGHRVPRSLHGRYHVGADRRRQGSGDRRVVHARSASHREEGRAVPEVQRGRRHRVRRPGGGILHLR